MGKVKDYFERDIEEIYGAERADITAFKTVVKCPAPLVEKCEHSFIDLRCTKCGSPFKFITLFNQKEPPNV